MLQYENFPPNFYLGDDDTATPTEENPVPLTRLEAFKEKSKPEQYACAAAWALTAVTGMGLDLKPITVIENLYTIMVVAIGMMLYATVIAQVCLPYRRRCAPCPPLMLHQHHACETAGAGATGTFPIA